MCRDVVVFAVADALGREICGLLHRFVEAVAVQVHPGDYRADDVARSAAVAADAVGHHDFRFFALAVNEIHDLLAAVMDARHHDVFGALFGKRLAHVLDFDRSEFPVAVIGTCQGAEFGEVRREDVGVAYQSAHLFAQARRVRFVEASVVAHHRVDQREHAIFLKSLDEVDDDVHLFLGAEESRRDGVETHVQIFVRLDVVAHLGGVIVKEILGELCMCREDCSRHRDRLDFHGRDDGRHDGNRAAAETSDIVDERNLLLWHNSLNLKNLIK